MSRQLRIWLAVGLAATSAALTLWLHAALRPRGLDVVVAARTVEPFTLLTARDLAVVRADAATAARLFPDAFAAAGPPVGRIAVRRIERGEVLRAADPGLVQPARLDQALEGGRVPLSALVPGGYRAVTVETGPSGAAPGDFVQLYGAGAGRVQQVVGRPLRVIAAGDGSLVVLAREGPEVEQVLASAAGGRLQAVLAPAPAGAGEAGT